MNESENLDQDQAQQAGEATPAREAVENQVRRVRALMDAVVGAADIWHTVGGVMTDAEREEVASLWARLASFVDRANKRLDGTP